MSKLSDNHLLCRFEDEKFEEVINIPHDEGRFSAIGVYNGGLYLSFYNWNLVEYRVWKLMEQGGC